MSSLLDQFLADIPFSTRSVGADYVSALSEGPVESADALGFTVVTPDGYRRVHVEGGLNERIYDLLSEHVAHDEQVILAKGVLASLFPTEPNWKLPTAWGSLCQKLGHDDEWLPEAVAQVGFAALAVLLQAEIEKMPSTLALVVNVGTHPTWDAVAGELSFGSHHCRFRNQPGGNVRRFLDELQRRKWPRALILDGYDEETVRDVRKKLVAKTQGWLVWHAGADGELSWERP